MSDKTLTRQLVNRLFGPLEVSSDASAVVRTMGLGLVLPSKPLDADLHVR